MAKPRVLIVDDSETARRQLSLELEKKGVQCVEASEGIEALWRAREQRFDLVLTDVHMPAMDGLTFTKELRRVPGYETIPVFVLTSDRSAERLRQGKEAGATAWIVKPAHPGPLARAIFQAVAGAEEFIGGAESGGGTSESFGRAPAEQTSPTDKKED